MISMLVPNIWTNMVHVPNMGTYWRLLQVVWKLLCWVLAMLLLREGSLGFWVVRRSSASVPTIKDLRYYLKATTPRQPGLPHVRIVFYAAWLYKVLHDHPRIWDNNRRYMPTIWNLSTHLSYNIRYIWTWMTSTKVLHCRHILPVMTIIMCKWLMLLVVWFPLSLKHSNTE